MSVTFGIPYPEILDRIDSKTFSLYQAYYNVAPFGEERADLRMGILASTIANCHGNKTKPFDFMPKFDRKKQTVDEMFNMFKAHATIIKEPEV